MDLCSALILWPCRSATRQNGRFRPEIGVPYSLPMGCRSSSTSAATAGSGPLKAAPPPAAPAAPTPAQAPKVAVLCAFTAVTWVILTFSSVASDSVGCFRPKQLSQFMSMVYHRWIRPASPCDGQKVMSRLVQAFFRHRSEVYDLSGHLFAGTSVAPFHVVDSAFCLWPQPATQPAAPKPTPKPVPQPPRLNPNPPSGQTWAARLKGAAAAAAPAPPRPAPAHPRSAPADSATGQGCPILPTPGWLAFSLRIGRDLFCRRYGHLISFLFCMKEKPRCRRYSIQTPSGAWQSSICISPLQVIFGLRRV